MNGERTQRLLIRVVVLGGAAAMAAAWTASGAELDSGAWRRALVMLGVTIAAEMISLRLPHGDSAEHITLGEVAIAADIALLPPPLAATVTVTGVLVTMVVRRRAGVKVAYNVAQNALGTVAASAVYHGLGGGDIETSRGLAALFGGMAAFAGSNLLTISAILATVSGRPLRRVLREEYALSLAIALGNSSVGIVAVALWLERPVLLAATLAPALALHLAYRGWVRQRELVGEIEDQKAKLERIVHHSSEGIALADASGTVALWSQSMERITGVPAAEAEGKSLGFLLRGRSAGGGPAHVEVGGEDLLLEIARADGTQRWLRVRHGPARDEEGTLRWDVIVVHDVTAERETEKMKEHFLAIVSHELRTPLTPILGYAKFLLRRDDIPANVRREALASMIDRAEHMQRLVEDLLLASSIGERQGGRVHARREPVDVSEVIGRVVRAVRSAHPDREILVDDTDAALVYGDGLRLSQILGNLLDNAIKYSPPSSPVAVRVTRDGERIAISVADSGRGIPADRVREVFRKFRRLEDPDRMETGGAGLGLFIVEQLAKAMGGSVDVDSRVGRGSTFTVRLPALSHPGGGGRAASRPRALAG